MGLPDGKLTATQFEILQFLWDSANGMTVVQLWEAIRAGRDVSRTTVLNLADRLEKRDWLRREKVDGVFRYKANVDRQTTETQLASDFVGEFFDGSPSSFVLSLLGSKGVSKSEIQRLRKLLDDETAKPKQRRGKKS